MKTGEYIEFDGVVYLFLGYSDYKRKWGVLADQYGNKHTRYLG